MLAVLLAPWLLVDVAAVGGAALLVGHAAAQGSAVLGAGAAGSV